MLGMSGVVTSVYRSRLWCPLVVPINEQLVDQSIREIILEPRPIVTVVDPGERGCHTRRTRQTGFAVDQQNLDPIPH